MSIKSEVVSLFQKVEDEVVSTAEQAWAEVEHIYTEDVKPIIKAAMLYVEQNGAADLLTIAKRVVGEFIAAGGNWVEALPAIAGTVIDELKQAGQAIEHGAAHLAVAMAGAEVQAAVAGNGTAQASQ